MPPYGPTRAIDQILTLEEALEAVAQARGISVTLPGRSTLPGGFWTACGSERSWG